jgi:hypothetical protein
VACPDQVMEDIKAFHSEPDPDLAGQKVADYLRHLVCKIDLEKVLEQLEEDINGPFAGVFPFVYQPGKWIPTKKKLYPDKPCMAKGENVPCLIVHKGQVLLRQWNCKHLVWDDEDGDDFFCKAEDVDYWMLVPQAPLPISKEKRDAT